MTTDKSIDYSSVTSKSACQFCGHPRLVVKPFDATYRPDRRGHLPYTTAKGGHIKVIVVCAKCWRQQDP